MITLVQLPAGFSLAIPGSSCKSSLAFRLKTMSDTKKAPRVPTMGAPR